MKRENSPELEDIMENDRRSRQKVRKPYSTDISSINIDQPTERHDTQINSEETDQIIRHDDIQSAYPDTYSFAQIQPSELPNVSGNLSNLPEISVKSENGIVESRNVNNTNNSKRGIAYLTPNMNRSGSGMFNPEGLLPDASPFTYSIRTVSTSALNEKTLVNKPIMSPNMNFSIDEVPRQNINRSIQPHSNIELIGESTFTGDEVHDLSNNTKSLSNYDTRLVHPNNNNGSPQFHSSIQPRIQYAVNQLRMDITGISEGESQDNYQKIYFSNKNNMPPKDTPKSSYIIQNSFAGSNDINYILQQTNDIQQSLSSRSRLSESESPVSNASIESTPPIESQQRIPDLTYKDFKDRKLNATKRFCEDDKAESIKIAIPDESEKYNLVQHISYDSISSFDSGNLAFDDVYSPTRIGGIILLCIIIPPLFFIIGLSSGTPKSNSRLLRLILKRDRVFDLIKGYQLDYDTTWFRTLCLWLGFLEILAILACIGIGFGVGLTRE
ncbi:hypothetical protein DAKH74_004410 [Maudiozyma humilis]|uniref:Uncharacterized protein n=1 Tax=Maudiozyma humilis TaxID=51915 RepID=A0AAV5RQY6_MAUHU|nr:hypothetical protein DAKH74_004410 [Kazachstania humilis]